MSHLSTADEIWVFGPQDPRPFLVTTNYTVATPYHNAVGDRDIVRAPVAETAYSAGSAVIVGTALGTLEPVGGNWFDVTNKLLLPCQSASNFSRPAGR